jgi:hypothetical protein
MVEILEQGISERRSIEEAHADMLASYIKRPTAALARMIEQLKAEIAARIAALKNSGSSK